MNHFFDIEIAQQYGILEAVLLNHFEFWIDKNKANEKNFYDGCYWTYNSTAAFSKLFPYASKRQIEKALKNLRDQGLIKTGNYNENKYDRTLWYAFTEKGESILHRGNIHITKNVNGFHQDVTTIPDNNPVTETDYESYNSPLTPQGEKAAEEKPKPKKEKVDKDAPLVSLCKAYSDDPEVQGLLLEWLDVRKQKRAVKSVNAIQRNLATLKDMAQQSGMSVKQYLEEVVRRGWQAFYVVPNYGNNSQQKRLPTEDDYCDLWG